MIELTPEDHRLAHISKVKKHILYPDTIINNSELHEKLFYDEVNTTIRDFLKKLHLSEQEEINPNGLIDLYNTEKKFIQEQIQLDVEDRSFRISSEGKKDKYFSTSGIIKPEDVDALRVKSHYEDIARRWAQDSKQDLISMARLKGLLQYEKYLDERIIFENENISKKTRSKSENYIQNNNQRVLLMHYLDVIEVKQSEKDNKNFKNKSKLLYAEVFSEILFISRDNLKKMIEYVDIGINSETISKKKGEKKLSPYLKIEDLENVYEFLESKGFKEASEKVKKDIDKYKTIKL